jgi:hypothetical protein
MTDWLQRALLDDRLAALRAPSLTGWRHRRCSVGAEQLGHRAGTFHTRTLNVHFM